MKYSEEKKKAIETLKKDIKNPLACGDIVIVAVDDLEKALTYIEELERKLKIKNGDISWIQKTMDKHFIDKQVIRDKIKEYEKKVIEAREEDDDIKKLYYEQEIQVLKSIIGE